MASKNLPDRTEYGYGAVGGDYPAIIGFDSMAEAVRKFTRFAERWLEAYPNEQSYSARFWVRYKGNPDWTPRSPYTIYRETEQH